MHAERFQPAAVCETGRLDLLVRWVYRGAACGFAGGVVGMFTWLAQSCGDLGLGLGGCVLAATALTTWLHPLAGGVGALLGARIGAWAGAAVLLARHVAARRTRVARAAERGPARPRGPRPARARRDASRAEPVSC